MMLQVMEMLEEYFNSGDVAEVARSLAEQVPAVRARCTDDRLSTACFEHATSSTLLLTHTFDVMCCLEAGSCAHAG